MKKSNKTVRTFIVKLLALFLIVSVTFTYFYFTAKKADAAWFDDGWRYRVAIPISAHTTAESNVYLSLTGSDGINTTDTTKFQTDCGDIRFTDEGGNILPYFLTTACGLAQTGFHVFFESFPAGAQTIYYYYGNAGAPNGFSSSDFPVAATGVTLGTRGSETNSPVSPVAIWTLNEGFGQTVNNSITTSFSGTLGPDGTSTSTDPTWVSEDMCIAGKCLQFTSSSSQYVNVSSSVAAVKSIGFWVRPTSTSTSLVVLNGAAGNASISVSSGTISAGAGFTTPTIYVNGVVSSSIVANSWQYVTITTGTGITASNIMLGRVNTGYLNGFMDEVKLYGVTLTASQVKANYSAGLGKSSSIKGTSVSFGGGQGTSLSQGLVGYWKMDETSWTVDCSTDSVTDYSGNGNHGLACPNSSGPSGGATGKFGYSGQFDGTDNYVSINNSTVYAPMSAPFAASAWVYQNAFTDNYPVILRLRSDDTEPWFIIFSNMTGLLGLSVGNAGNFARIKTNTPAANLVGAWRHVAVSYNGNGSTDMNNFSLYLDGVLQTNVAGSSYTTNTQGTSIGYDSGGNELDGYIDEVRIYNRAISSAEVSILYAWAPGPVGYWKMDENTGSSSTYDSSGNENTGTVSNFTSWNPGKLGGALEFNNSNTNVNVGSAAMLDNLKNTGLSAEAWIYPQSINVNGSRIFAKESTSSTNRWIMTLTTSNKINFLHSCTPTSNLDIQTSVASTDIALNSWQHVAVSWTGGTAGTTVSIYINGVSQPVTVNSDCVTTFADDSANDLMIGDSNHSSIRRPFDGYIDDAKIYNYARTPGQIIEDMNGGHPAPGSPVGSAVAHWKFDEGALDTCPGGTNDFCDSSVNGNALTGSQTVTKWTNNGKFGKAYASGAVVATRSDDSDFDFAATDELSMSMWLYADAANKPTSGNVQYVYAKGGIVSAGTVGYTVYTNSSGNVTFAIRSSSGNWVATPPAEPTSDDKVTSTTDIYDSTWHHIVVTKTGTSRIDIFVDGKLENSDTSLTATGTLANTVTSRFGDRNETDDGDEFVGRIDEMKIYRLALSGDQVKVEYNSGFQTQMGALSTDSSGNPSNSANDEYCPPGQGSTCIGPIHHWNMNENTGATIYDIGSDKANGTFGAVNAAWSPGVKGSAITLNTTNDDVTIGDANVNGLTAATIDAWVKRTVTGTDVLIGEENAGARTGFLFEWYSDNLMYCQAHTGSAYANIRYSEINDLLWHHVACVYDGSQAAGNRMKIYVDGILRTPTSTSGTIPTAIVSDDTNFKIGSNLESTKGTVDEVKVYNYARTPAQIAWDMNRGKPVGWWKFDENSGTTAYDASGNGYNSQTFTGNTAYTTGKLNSALTFDGTDDVVRITEGTNIDIGATSDSYTISVWMKTSASCTGTCDIIAKSTSTTSTHPLRLQLDSSNYPQFTIRDSANSVANKNIALNDGVWHHLVAVRNVTTDLLYLYIDGTLVDTTTDATTATCANNNDISIGNGGGSYTTNDFNGQVDDVRIYRYPLSTQQVKTVMSEGAVRFGSITGMP